MKRKVGGGWKLAIGSEIILNSTNTDKGEDKNKLTGLPDFSWYYKPKWGKMCQMTRKYTWA
jgi:hypothetical protein